MKIRKIKATDYPDILKIYNYYIENTTINFEEQPINIMELSAKVDKITSRYPFYVLEENNEVLAYAYLSEFNSRSAYDITADLAIYLKPNIDSRGYGSRLYDRIEETARKSGIRNTISLITEGNDKSVRFHLKHGFREVGKIENAGYKFNKYLSVHYFQKEI